MIEVRGLQVDYGEVTAVRDVDLSIPPGTVYGLIGPNGAGKTSTLRTLAGLLEPTQGSVRVCDIDLLEAPRSVLHRIGYMPDFPPIYPRLEVWAFLDLFAASFGIPLASRAARIDAVIEEARLGDKRRALCGTLSRGMKQRLFLAKTLLPDPDVLLLDEPASGLDPAARIELRGQLVALGARGKTVVVSSHILTEMDEFCTAIGIMQRGSLVVSGPIDTIRQASSHVRRFELRLVAADPRLVPWLGERPGVATVAPLPTGAGATFALPGSDADAAALLAAAVTAGFAVCGLTEKGQRLEDLFLEIGATEVS